jgi:hypothetical protein
MGVGVIVLRSYGSPSVVILLLSYLRIGVVDRHLAFMTDLRMAVLLAAICEDWDAATLARGRRVREMEAILWTRELVGTEV